MNPIRIIIPGKIAPKDRPRFARHAFTTARTRAQEKTIADYAALAMRGIRPFTGPVWLDIQIEVNHPASWSEKRKCETRWVIERSDLDNIIKTISDSLNKISYTDDHQIVKISAERVYVKTQEQVIISVWDLSAPPFVHGDCV
jgi:Holliday junction resolvase RusA-like endonuclease